MLITPRVKQVLQHYLKEYGTESNSYNTAALQSLCLKRYNTSANRCHVFFIQGLRVLPFTINILVLLHFLLKTPTISFFSVS